MMFMHIRRNLLCISKTSSVSVSLLQSFSTSVEKQISPRLEKIEKYDSVISFLKERGFSDPQLERILKSPLISANLEGIIKPKIKFFQDSGFSADDIAEIISNDPRILCCSLNNRLMPSLLVLTDLLGSSSKVAEVLKISGFFLKCDVENTMGANIEYLKSCGLAMEHISWLMYRIPRALMRKPESMMKFVERIDEIGIKRSSKMFIRAIGELARISEETLGQKLKAFENLGLSEDEIKAACRKAPQMFSVSEEKMNKFKEVVLASGKYDISCVVKYPMSLTYSVEKRYKPRLKVLGILESNNLIKDWPNFRDFYLMTDEEFFKNYVSPYLSIVGDLREFASLFCGKRSGS